MNNKTKHFERAEFIELLRRNRITLICGPVFVVLIGTVFIFVVFWLDGSGRMIENTVHSLDYTFAIESNYPIEKNTFIKFDAINSLKNEGKVTNVIVYMQVPSVSYDDKIPMSCSLSKGEIALSEKTADKLKIKTGDTVQLDFVMYDEPINYSVKYIFGYVSDFYAFEENHDFSPVLLPFESGLSDGMKKKYVSFLGKTDRNTFMADDESYLSETNVNDELSEMHKKRVIIPLVSLVLFFGALFSYLYFLSKALSAELERYYLDSYSVKTVRRYGFYLITLDIMIPIVIVLTIMAYFTASGVIIWQVSYAFTIIGTLILLILYIRNGRIYGKAH